MREVDFAWAVWRLVEAILEVGVPAEPLRRMIVSRLYYAAYHVALLLLRNAGWTPVVGTGAHRAVLRELEQRYVNTGRMNRIALDALADLFQLRVDADYHLDVRIRERTVRNAMRWFRRKTKSSVSEANTFFDESRQILGVT